LVQQEVAVHSQDYDNGILVVPDSKSPHFAYLSPRSSIAEYLSDHLECERKLAQEVFSSVASSKQQTQIKFPSPLKLRCGACMLAKVPNASVVVMGGIDEVSTVLQEAHVRADVTRAAAAAATASESGLHHDHAHMLMSIPLLPLINACMAKTRQSKSQANETLHRAICQFNMDHQNKSDFDLSKPKKEFIKLEHHLTTVFGVKRFYQCLPLNSSTSSFLRTPPRKNEQTTNNKNDWLQSMMVLVLAYDDGDYWSLDLPGGKRHLGETAWSCARRETFEESSLVIDEEGIYAARHVASSSSSSSSSYSTSSTASSKTTAMAIGANIGSTGAHRDSINTDRTLMFIPKECTVNCGMAYYLLTTISASNQLDMNSEATANPKIGKAAAEEEDKVISGKALDALHVV
jgi:hypothetical protein